MKLYHVQKFLKGEYSLADVTDYIRGNIRYKLYFSKFYFLLRSHIFEQIQYRINVMDKECYLSGSCKICGCNTPHLQMANKTCEGKCYPIMMDYKEWEEYKYKNNIYVAKY
jgi:hypothetical protein